MPYISKLNLPELDEQSPFTKKQQKELANTLAVFREAGSNKTKADLTEWGVNRHSILSRMFYMYLFSKYGNSCPIFRGYGASEIALEIEIYDENKKIKVTKEIQNYLSQVKKCISAGKDLVVCPVRLLFKEGAHANLLIFRSASKSIEVFEPHGQAYKGGNISSAKVFEAYHVVADAFNRGRKTNKYTLFLSDEVCPDNQGFQSLEGLSWFRKQHFEGGGYCSVWSMFMTELILMNPKMSTSQVLSEALKLVKNQADGNNTHVSIYLLDLIRGYTTYLTRRVEKYFTLIFGKPAMIAIRNGNKKPSREQIIFAHKMFDAYAFVSNQLALNKKATLNSIEADMHKYKFMFTEKYYEQIIKVINAMRDEEYGKYSDPGHHTPGMIHSITKKNTRSKGNDRNEKGNYIKSKTKKADIKPCPPGKERNPDTGRCRKIPMAKTKKVAIHSSPKKNTILLKPCPPGKERNPDTGRCRKIPMAKTKKVAIHSSPKKNTILLKPCPPGKERNPDTGRCRKIPMAKTKKVAIHSSPKKNTILLKPCPPGKERNPDTGRCRKIPIAEKK
jgi:hypothetical protein